MTYTCKCGYDGLKGWVVARTTRDFALGQFNPGEAYLDLVGEISESFPDNPYAGGGDAELQPEHHLSCPQCGEDLDESDLWPVEEDQDTS